MEDPDTKALKAFGFCEFEEAEGVTRALNLLQNLAIGGQVYIPRIFGNYGKSAGEQCHILRSLS